MNKDIVSRAVEAYLNTFDGADAARLHFFEGLWDVQQTIDVSGLSYEPIGARAIREALRADHTIFEVNPPEIPAQNYRDALSRIVHYVIQMAGLPTRQAEALAALDFATLIDADRLALAACAPAEFVTLVREDLDAASKSDLPAATLAFVLLAALTPFLEEPAALSMSTLDKDARDACKSAHCPVCGSAATLAQVGETASSLGAGRTLWCGVCHAEWDYERIRCSRCGSRSQSSLRYVHVEDDEAHRLHVCKECNGYIRTVFRANSTRPIALQVEDVAMAGLDAVGQAVTRHG